MSVPNQLFSNNATSLLKAPISQIATTMTVMTGYGALFPQPVDAGDFFLVTLENQAGTAREILRVRGRSGDMFTNILRAQEGTIAQMWTAALGDDTLVDHRVTAETMRQALLQPLGGAVGAVADGNFILAANSIAQNLQVLDTHFGANFAAGNYITLNQTVAGAVTALDTAIGANVSNGNYILGANKVQANITALDAAIGPNVSNGAYILATNKVQANITALDAAIGKATLTTVAAGITAVTTIDTAPVGATVVKWLIRCVQASTPANVYATEVYALANDTGTASDFTCYATLKLGATIPGLTVAVATSGGALILTVASGAGVNVTARRVSVI